MRRQSVKPVTNSRGAPEKARMRFLLLKKSSEKQSASVRKTGQQDAIDGKKSDKWEKQAVVETVKRQKGWADVETQIVGKDDSRADVLNTWKSKLKGLTLLNDRLPDVLWMRVGGKCPIRDLDERRLIGERKQHG